MTVIVGVVDGTQVWIGGDSHGAAGCQRYPRTDLERKVFRRGEMLFGVTGASRAIQLFQHVLDIPEHPDGVEPFVYLVTLLMPAIRHAIQEHDGLKINDSSDGWQFLLGYRGGLYDICHDLSVSPLPAYGAVGCGREYATGSLSTTAYRPNWADRSQPLWSPQERVRLALEVAAEHDVHVAGPFVVESVG